MKNRKSWRRKALIFALVAGGLVLAGCGLFTKQMTSPSGILNPLDDLVPVGGDLLKVGNSNRLILYGDVGDTVTGTLYFYIERQGGGANAFANNAEVTVSWTDQPASDDPLVVQIHDPGKITLPDDWLAQDKGTTWPPRPPENPNTGLKVTVSLTVTSSTESNFQRELHFRASGPDAKGGTRATDCSVHVEFERRSSPPPTYTLSGVKWWDKDADGEWDQGEPGLGDWKITLYKWNGSDYAWFADTTTGPGGTYAFANLLAGKYKVEEEVQENWVQTYPLNPPYYEVTITNADIVGLDFGNVRTYSISGAKWYDRNKNGEWDSDEPPIEGWKIELYDSNGNDDPIKTTYTDANGVYQFSGLEAGTYVVKEGPVSGTWIQTFPLNPNYHEVTIVDDDVTGVNFGNVCEITASGGYTLGFWSNKNGQSVLSKNSGWMAYLNGYNLRTKSGTKFTITSYTGFRDWLLKADAVNMSYMLSVQLSATLLNIKYMGTNYTGLGIVVGGEWNSIDELISMANSFLGTYNNTPAGHPKRGEAEFYKNVFDALNNNQLKLIPYSPCPVPNWP